MPPTAVHLNGSVNLPDVETVFREVLAHVPAGLRRVPDGEPGERSSWIGTQLPKIAAADGLEIEPVDRQAGDYVTGIPRFVLRDGVDAGDIVWPELGYATAYQASYETFRALRREGVVPAEMRFQVQYPTPFAVIGSFVAGRDLLAVEPAYERALLADLATLMAAVEHDSVAVQWDVAVEFVALEAPETLQLPGGIGLDAIVERLARCVDAVPADVPVGLHMCYGDYEHRHFADPTSLELQVRMINALTATANRPVDWFSVTVPQQERRPEFFAPLADLQMPERTELYLAVVPYHPQRQPAGTTDEQIELIDRQLGSRAWGICTECGMGRVASDEIAAMLDHHRELLERFAVASG